MAEHVLLMILAVSRHLPELLGLQREREPWQPLEGRELRELTVGMATGRSADPWRASLPHSARASSRCAAGRMPVRHGQRATGRRGRRRLPVNRRVLFVYFVQLVLLSPRFRSNPTCSGASRNPRCPAAALQSGPGEANRGGSRPTPSKNSVGPA